MIHPDAYRGLWFLPAKPRNKVAGVLRFTPGDPTYLELDGVFDKSNNFLDLFNREMRDAPIILGVTSTGVPITLYKCFEKSFQGNTSSTYLAHVIFIGDHFKEEEKIIFSQLNCHFTNLEEWTKTNIIKSEFTGNGKELLVHCEKPISIQLTTNGLQKINLDTVWSAQLNRGKVDIQQSSFFRIIFNQPSTLNTCLSLIRGLQDFLGIAMGKPPFPIRIEAWPKISARRNTSNKPIKILFTPVLAYNPDKKYFHEMLFTVADIRETSDRFINNWLEKRESLEPVYNLYFANLHSPFTYVENRFLNLIQAIETYHRRVLGGKYMDNDEYLNSLYPKFVEAIPEDFDKDFRESLVRGKLRYANEYSLRKRLIDLLRKCSDAFPEDFLGSSKMRDYFISQVVDTRNYLTHYDETNKENVAEETRLFELEQGLKVIMEVVLLVEIGFSVDKIQEMIVKSEAYRLFRRSETV